MPANGLMAPLKVFDQTQQHQGNWGSSARYGQGAAEGTAKFRYEVEVCVLNDNERNWRPVIIIKLNKYSTAAPL